MSEAAASPRPLRLHLRLALYLSFNTLTVLGALWLAPPTWELIGVALVSYYVRMFAVTAVYHRLFAHRSYTPRNRLVQFVLALWALTSAQRGPIWWSTTHRWHHRHADTPLDLHSPSQQGLWESHILWVFTHRANPSYQPPPPTDLLRLSELVWLDRLDILGPVGLGVGLYALGGLPYVLWGLGVATVLLWHGSSSINSLGHTWGDQAYDTGDQSRNNLWLLPVTLGENWHNNHHAYPGAARHGHRPGEWDPTGALITLWWRLGLVTRVNPGPSATAPGGGAAVRARAAVGEGA